MNIQGTPGNNSDHPERTKKYQLPSRAQQEIITQTEMTVSYMIKNTLTAVIHEYFNAKVAAHTKLTIENGGKTPLRVTRPKQPSSNTVLFCWFVLLIG